MARPENVVNIRPSSFPYQRYLLGILRLYLEVDVCGHECLYRRQQIVGDLLYVGRQQRLVVDVAIADADWVVDRQHVGFVNLTTKKHRTSEQR